MPDHDPIDTAWRIHADIADWTGKVDTKASFTSALETALLVGVLGIAGGKRRLSHLDGAALVVFWIGVAVLVASLLAVLYVVRPRIRSREMKPEAGENFIFFGHVKDWQPNELAAAISERDLLPVLSRKIVTMSKIAWAKHRLLQLSVTGAVVAGALISLAAVLED